MSDRGPRPEVFHLDTGGGRRFCVATRPREQAGRGLLHLHAFAEELNTSRRMVSRAARAFADRGWLVLQLDHGGCGDSSGLMSGMSWRDWLDDVSLGVEWLRTQGVEAPVLWSLRAGSLVAGDWIRRSGETPPLLLWQPVPQGRVHLKQFLRLKVVGEMLGGAEARQAAANLQTELDAGRPVEVAGYPLSADLAKGMEASVLELPEGYGSPVSVLEVTSADRTTPSPALSSLVERWREGSVPADVRVVEGPSFWLSHESAGAPGLISASSQILNGWT